METALSKEWFAALEDRAAANFVNLPIEFQLRGYDYSFISKKYLNFFRGSENTRQEKLQLARKFLKFIRSINRNRAKHELGEDFFECFEYFMDNFSDLLAKQDLIHLSALDIMTEAVDKSQFVEDVISLDDLKRRAENLEQVKQKEEIIDAEWTEFEREYLAIQGCDTSSETRHEQLR